MKALKSIIELVFWMAAGLAAIVGLGVLFAIVLTPALGYLGALVAIGLMPAGVLAARAVRRKRAASVLGYVEQAVRLNLPLPQLLEAAARSENGRTADRLARLRASLEGGHSISSALERTNPQISTRDASRLAAGERIGRLDLALARIARERHRASHRGGEADAIFIRGYPLAMGVAVTLLIAVLLIFVMPKFQQISHDFGMRLPPVTQCLLVIANVAGLPIMMAVGVIVVLACGFEGRAMLHAGSAHDQAFRPATDWLRWITPFLHGIERDRSLADACTVIADALAAGFGAEIAVRDAAELDVNSIVKRRLVRWARGLEAGRGLAESARSASLPSMMVGMLSPVRGAEAAEVVRFLARYYDTRFNRSAALLRGAAIPLMVFGFAIIVGFVALALFTPMIHMVDYLSSHAMRF